MHLGKEHVILASIYGVVGLILALVARQGKLAPIASATFLAILWLGFVLAISFTEAWIKFRAPFISRYLALDVGRVVFAALNAVEAGLCLGLWLVYWIGTSADATQVGRVGILIALTVIYIIQAAVVHPKLHLRGDFAIYEELKRLPEDSLTFHQKMLYTEMQNNVTNHRQPPVFFHIAYVLAEVSKVVLLVHYSVHFLRQLSGTA
ncbi:hypothetical protein Poli38472_000103 [Pythium oligandrum]|uniref:Uncharacterized protein n=1 Tax=Pythium oligandrum TaxID=41045 RepID=A0A8K1FF18_PYTOL|nr:hypothetical protein Poli38472_000103 [Pythium oligandrum]|eukprot:TMW60061.1 hypothetical protein Poli38472_000103 [Pythium oligandrum]